MKTQFGRLYGKELRQDPGTGCWFLYDHRRVNRAADDHEVAMWENLPTHLTEFYDDDEIDSYVLGEIIREREPSDLDEIVSWFQIEDFSRDDVDSSLWRLHDRDLIRMLLDGDDVLWVSTDIQRVSRERELYQ